MTVAQLRESHLAAAYHIPYAAQASCYYRRDLIAKAEKAFQTPGPAFLNVVTPRAPGWAFDTDQTVEMARLAVDGCSWPLYEITNETCNVRSAVAASVMAHSGRALPSVVMR